MTQLVLCFDGTNNTITGGSSDTSVAKLCKVLAPADGRQLLYYDPGVGNVGQLPGVAPGDKLRARLQRLYGLALGRGVYQNMADAYLFLMRNWQPGDQIYVFGFSRGAFTARGVAGLVARFGIMRPSMDTMVATLVHLFFADRTDSPAEQDAIRDQIAACFCSAEGAVAEVWFTGVWDTVESVGSPLSRKRIKTLPTIVGQCFRHVRHALALDEHRNSFTPQPYIIEQGYPYADHGQSIKQVWWRGAHCDIGGGYSDAESGLSDEALLWMLDESIGKGLLVKEEARAGDGVDRDGALALVRTPAQPGGLLQPRTPLAHSEDFSEAYWALCGLHVRRYDEVKGIPAGVTPEPPVASPTVAIPVASVWSRPSGQWGKLAAAWGLGAFFWWLQGVLALGEVGASLGDIAQANMDIARWQLTWWQERGPSMPDVKHPVWMVLADGGFMLAYGYVLARGMARGFGVAAGLRNLSMPVPRMLNLLGLSGLIIVGADVVEDVLMLGTFYFHHLGWAPLEVIAAGLMTVAAAVKWLGFIPALLLVSRRWAR